MSLKVFDTKDAIPEALRDSAIETKDGKFAVADVSGLKQSQERLLDEKKKLQEKYEGFEQALGGMSPEEIAKLRDKYSKDEDEAARRAGEFDKIVEKRVNETKAEYEKRLAELAPYREKYVDREIEIAIRDAAAKGGVPVEDVPFVVDLHKGRRVRFDDKTGKLVVFDKDGDQTGLTVEKFYAETFKAEAPKFYGAEGGSGGGASGGGNNAPRVPAGAVSARDNASFIANLDKVAAGQVRVVTG